MLRQKDSEVEDILCYEVRPFYKLQVVVWDSNLKWLAVQYREARLSHSPFLKSSLPWIPLG